VKRIALVIFVTLITACGGPGARSWFGPAIGPATRHRGSSSPIQHIVIIVQENRSFDNFFYGFPGANSATSGKGHDGRVYQLQPLHLKWTHDMNHYHWQFLEDFDKGKNDGWEDQVIQPYKKGKYCTRYEWENHPKCWNFMPGKVYMQMPYSYTIQAEIQPYWDMAEQYTLGDDTFASNNGPTFVAHQYLVAGQSGHASEVPSTYPWGCDAPNETEFYLHYGQANPPAFKPAVGHDVNGPDPCFPLNGSGPSSTYPTIADLLDAAGITWRYYVQPKAQDSYWLNAFEAVKAVRYGPDWQNNISMPDTNVLDDITNGDLPQVSWVMPHKGASDHAGGGSDNKGPDWVTSIVNEIGQSKYWKSTAIVIVWDEWGGWYDHVLPPQYPDPGTGAYEGLGYRVPLIIVSPYAKTHYVSHDQHEIASTLHFIEQTFNLPFLGAGSGQAYADQRDRSAFADCFDYNQKPTKFKVIKPVKEPAQYFKTRTFGPEIDY
jgi:phospholipase C